MNPCAPVFTFAALASSGELLTNSFKYALKENKEMNISLSIKEYNNKENYVLLYSDNGNGLPVDFDLANTDTMGMVLMKDLCRQIGGKINYHFNNESTFTIEFLSMKGRKLID